MRQDFFRSKTDGITGGLKTGSGWLMRVGVIGLALSTGGSAAADGDGGCISFDPIGSHSIAQQFPQFSQIQTEGSRAYVSNGLNILRVFDISDPSNPAFLGQGSVGTYFPFVVDFALRDDIAFLAVNSADTTSSGLFILDMTDPSAPVQVGTFDTIRLIEIEVVGDTVYAVSGIIDAPTLYIFDVSTLSSPALLSSTLLPGNQLIEEAGISVVGSTVYVAAGGEGLLVYQVEDLTSPALIGSYDTPGLASDVVVDGSFAYVADGAEGLKVFSVSDPTTPTLVGSFQTADQLHTVEYQSTSIVIYGQVGNLGSGLLEDSGIVALDVQNPALVTQFGFNQPTGDQFKAFAVNGDTMLTADTFTLELFDVVNSCSGTCDSLANLNGDDSIDWFDVSVWIHAFIVGDLSIADINGDGVLNSFDFSAFLAAFQAGCP